MGEPLPAISSLLRSPVKRRKLKTIFRCNSTGSTQLPSEKRYNCLLHDKTVWKSEKQQPWDQESHNTDDVIESVTQRSNAWIETKLQTQDLNHTISRCNAKFDKKSLPRVLSRLKEVFRRASLQVVYKNKPTLIAECRTMDLVTFVVTLWESNEFPADVVIEIQQCCGDRLAYYNRYSKYILHAADLNFDLESHNYDTDPIQDEIDAKIRRTLEMEGRSIVSDEILNSAVDIASDLLLSDRYDARLLGLESFKFLTDTKRAQSHSSVTNLARGILIGDNSDWNAIHYRICCLALTGYWWQEYEKQQPFLENDGSHYIISLQILSQSIDILTSEEKLIFITKANSILASSGSSTMRSTNCKKKTRSKSLIDILIDRVDCSRSNPHVGYYAAKILGSLLSSGDSDGSIRKRIQFHKACVSRSHNFGSTSHAALERATSILLNLVDDSIH